MNHFLLYKPVSPLRHSAFMADSFKEPLIKSVSVMKSEAHRVQKAKPIIRIGEFSSTEQRSYSHAQPFNQRFPKNHFQKVYLYGFYALACFLFLMVSLPALAAPSTGTKLKISPPPSVELQYAVKTQYSGMNIGGNAIVRWQNNGHEYNLQTEISATLLGKILSSGSKGEVGPNSLLPTQFTEKRLRKAQTTTNFNRANNTVEFSESKESVPLKGNEQDRASIVWQLVSIARANPDQLKPNAEFTIPVAGRKSVEPWVFRVMPKSSIETGVGTLATVHLVRVKDNGQRNEVWLAPSLEWYPVRLVISEKDNFRIEQTLQKTAPLTSK